MNNMKRKQIQIFTYFNTSLYLEFKIPSLAYSLCETRNTSTLAFFVISLIFNILSPLISFSLRLGSEHIIRYPIFLSFKAISKEGLSRRSPTSCLYVSPKIPTIGLLYFVIFSIISLTTQSTLELFTSLAILINFACFGALLTINQGSTAIQ